MDPATPAIAFPIVLLFGELSARKGDLSREKGSAHRNSIQVHTHVGWWKASAIGAPGILVDGCLVVLPF